MATHSVYLPGESHGQRSLAGYSPYSRKKSHITEVAEHAHVQLVCSTMSISPHSVSRASR